TELTGLLSDLGRPGSLAQSFTALTYTTRTLRDLVTDDVWPVIARMRSRLRSLEPGNSVPLEQGLSEIIDSCLTLSGAAADAMPRNLGWDLTEVGRKIERTLSLLALVRATLGRRRTRAAEARIAGAVASVTESGASYRRSYHAALQPELLLDLLLTDATLPRSIAFQLDRLDAVIDRLPEVSPTPELRAPLKAVRARVEGWRARELLRPLDASEGAATLLLEEADAAIALLRELATAVENRFFRPSDSASLWGFDDVRQLPRRPCPARGPPAHRGLLRRRRGDRLPGRSSDPVRLRQPGDPQLRAGPRRAPRDPASAGALARGDGRSRSGAADGPHRLLRQLLDVPAGRRAA